MPITTSINAFGSNWSKNAVASGNIIGSHQSTTPWAPVGVPYVHDFGLGPFNLNFSLDSTTLNWLAPLGNIKPNYTSISSGTGAYFSTLLDTGATGNPSDFQVNFTDLATTDGLKFTRTQKPVTGNPNAGNIMGPYNLSYATSGAKNFNLVLYLNNVISSYSSPPIPYYSGTANNVAYTGNTGTYTVSGKGEFYDNARFQLLLYQKGVPTITVGGPSGAVLSNGVTISGMDAVSNNTIVLNNSNSRVHQPSGSLLWSISKMTSSGPVPAVQNVDYQLGATETLTSSTITLKWLLSNNYSVTLTARNLTIPFATEQMITTVVNFSVGLTTINTIVLPIVQPIVTPVIAYDNTVVQTSPTLTGIDVFKVSVSANVGISSAVWTQQIDSNPPTTIVLSQAGWEAELLNRCDVACEVRGITGNNVLAVALGYGPHTFNLGIVPGGVKVGFEVAPKSTLILPYINTSSIGPPTSTA